MLEAFDHFIEGFVSLPSQSGLAQISVHSKVPRKGCRYLILFGVFKYVIVKKTELICVAHNVQPLGKTLGHAERDKAMLRVQGASKETYRCDILPPVFLCPYNRQVIYLMVIVQAWLDPITEALGIICRRIKNAGVVKLHSGERKSEMSKTMEPSSCQEPVSYT